MANDDLKARFKSVLREQELKVAESVLRWKYRKEGKDVPAESYLKDQAGEVVTSAREVISRRGKRVFDDFRRILTGKGE